MVSNYQKKCNQTSPGSVSVSAGSASASAGSASAFLGSVSKRTQCRFRRKSFETEQEKSAHIPSVVS